ncbi:alpha-xylosidase [Thermoanaerobacterium thermosaccharolyticum]|uniref:alpha-xylosidase n=1 Tax=Thermoanaerobacterium thermosaccharolyticum TaxID=1517 RepID=UPI003DA93BB7
MKFTNGQWLLKKGINILYPMQAFDENIDDESLTVYAPTSIINDRSDTINCPMITIKFSSPLENVIRVQIYHFKGVKKRSPNFEINEKRRSKINITLKDEYIIFKSGELSAKVSKNKFNIEYLYKNEVITSSKFKSIGYIMSENGDKFMREQLSLGVGECVYGLGEHFTPFVRNGQVIDTWNEDGGTSSEQAYKNIPFYITNKGYGVFVNYPGNVSFEVASENTSKVQFSVPEECLDYFIIGGDTLKDVIANYTELTGKPALPPAWSFGLWLSTSFTTDYDEKTVTSFIDGMLDRRIPIRVFHFDCFWMKAFQWCDFEWDKTVFPDVRNMLARLKDKNLKICVWINPYIAQKSPLFDEAMDNGYLLTKKNGDVWQWDLWQAGMGIVDFTNPFAREWYKEKLRSLLQMGVDCFKTDFGERIPTDVMYNDGSDPIKMHNYYTYLYNKTVQEILIEEKGIDNAVLFGRSATVGSQKFPVHWGGDCWATYESMAESLRGGLSLCLSGFGFWSHDIGGFENTATPDLYKRWVAFGLLSTHSRLHGSTSYRVPWLFDEESVDVLRFFAKLKNRLMPYIFSAACNAANTGIPVMRAMVLEFTDDPACEYLDKQYMLGDSLLVAPILNEEGIASYYLPKGRWTNFLTGEIVEGGCFKKEEHGYFSIPLMVRPNSIIPVGNRDDVPDYDYADNVEFHVFEIEDNTDVSTSVYNDKGQKEIEISVIRNDNCYKFNIKNNDKKISFILRNHKDIKKVINGTYEIVDLGVKIVPEFKADNVVIFI